MMRRGETCAEAAPEIAGDLAEVVVHAVPDEAAYHVSHRVQVEESMAIVTDEADYDSAADLDYEADYESTETEHKG